MTFDDLKLHPALLRAVHELGYAVPTPIQSEAIPPALEGRDVLACAMTGSGKTAAFLLPILQKLIDAPRGTTRALVLTPTRELAAQIQECVRELAPHSRVKSAAVFGGVGMGPQQDALRNGFDIIIATPGRLQDHMQHAYTNFKGLQYLVLDEADRMLDMGFLPEIRRILRQLPAKRQTFFFSATMPQEIATLAREMCHNPVQLQIERKSAPATGITQTVYPVPQELKSSLLVALLRGGQMRDTLVFTRTKHRANRLHEYLLRQKVSVERIHGNRSQAQRTAALAGFKNGRHQVLVATDIAARGIDVETLGHVVNFDVPLVPDDYIHRVGRTARAGATGHAFTFVAPEEEATLKPIERAIGRALPRVTVPDFNYTARPEARFEIPIGDRIRAIRERKAEERSRANHNRQRRSAGVHAGAGGSDTGGPGRGRTRHFRPKRQR